MASHQLPITAARSGAGGQQPPTAHVAAAAVGCGPSRIAGRLRHALVVPLAAPAAGTASGAGVAGGNAVHAGATLSAVAPLAAALAPELQGGLGAGACGAAVVNGDMTAVRPQALIEPKRLLEARCASGACGVGEGAIHAGAVPIAVAPLSAALAPEAQSGRLGTCKGSTEATRPNL